MHLNFISMKYLSRLIGLFCLILLHSQIHSQNWIDLMNDPNSNFYDIQKEFNNYWVDKSIEKGKGWRQFKRWEAFMEPRVYPSGIFQNDATGKAFESISLSSSVTDLKSSATKYWKPLGPFSIPASYGGAGRLNCVEYDPNNPNIIYVGAPSGGIWKSTDAGSSWSSTSDNMLSIGVTDIAVDYSNSNTIYIATGDGDFSDTYSIGVMKSTDGGKTWNTTGLNTTNGFNITDLKTISRILIHPTDPTIIFAATSTGVYRSSNSGDSWRPVISGSNFKDIKFKPGNPNTVYAVSTKNLYISTNGGNSFAINNALNFSTAVQRLMLGVTPADPQYIYVLAGAYGDGGYGGLYRSVDGGSTFALRSIKPNILGWTSDATDKGGQAAYDLSLAVSPVDKEIVYVGGVNLWKSVNGGQSWSINAFWQPGSIYPYVHADIHMLKFIKNSPSDIYACSDGGLSITTDAGKTWRDKSNGLSIAQIYRHSVSQTDPAFILTGWQDNGGNLLNSSSWYHVIGGDCMESAVDYTNNTFIYLSLYNGQMNRSVDDGNNWASISDDIKKVESGAWITPFVLDPVNPNILYAGFQNVWKTYNKGNSWSKISSFTNSNPFQAIAVAPSNTKYIYVANYSNVLKTTDGGTTWTNITTGLPITQCAITNICICPTNPNKVWVTLSGFVVNTKVYESVNGGVSWYNYSTGIPNIPVTSMVYQKGTSDNLYIGTDIGVYYRDASLKNWIPYMYGLPNVIVNKLEIQYSAKKLVAATYGRGLWQVDLYSAVGINEIAGNKNLPLKIYPNPSDKTINFSIGFDNSSSLESSLITIYNSVGQCLYNNSHLSVFNTMQSPVVQVDISGFPDGIYYVSLNNKKQSYSGSFIKHAE